LIVLLGWAALTPFEMLGWWAGWFGDRIYNDNIPAESGVRTVRPSASSYLLFLSGIGRVSGQTLSYREQEFLRRLAETLPHTVIIDDIFPYSVNNMALTGQPFFARFWQWALRRKVNGPSLAGYIINMRNILQVAMSTDKRYGPLYNQAMAEVMLDGLLRYQYDPESSAPIFLIGYSGAGQIAVGATAFLSEWIKGPIYIISLGGIFSSDPGLLAAAHTYHLWGSKDNAQVWRLAMPGRWKIMTASAWNRVLRTGRATIIAMEGVGHTGNGGYLDFKPPEAGGAPPVNRTVAVIADIVEKIVRRTEPPRAEDNPPVMPA
jgi:hypothetical protein